MSRERIRSGTQERQFIVNVWLKFREPCTQHPRLYGAMDKSEEYRQNAAYCRQMSEQASSAEIKANWLALAEKWIAMLPMPETILDVISKIN